MLLRVSTVILVFWALPALAQYEGEWRAGPLQIRHDVRSWGGDCGPRPPATLSLPGGTVQIAQSGDHLRFSGAVRGATNRCWSDKPSIRRVSSTFQGGRWTTVCRAPEGDSQPENGRYTFRADGERLAFEETTTWNWRLRTSSCQATRRATRTFTRVGAAPPPELPIEPPEPERNCDSVGPPARLRITPGQSTIAPGERVCFRARVVDAAGCTVSGGAIELSLRTPDGVTTGSFDGRCFQAGATAAEAEGLFRVVAMTGAMRSAAEVEVRTEDLSDLTAGRIRDPESPGTPGLSNAETNDASGVSARALAGDANGLWLGGGIALVVVLAGILLLVARRRRDDLVVEEPAQPQQPVGASARPRRRVCPVCGHQDHDGEGYCPNDGAELVDPDDQATRARGMICPTCRRGYGPEATTCTQDGEDLVPYSMFVLQQKTTVDVKKICPECGTTYDPEVTFCGKDGSTLETLN